MSPVLTGYGLEANVLIIQAGSSAVLYISDMDEGLDSIGGRLFIFGADMVFPPGLDGVYG